MQYPKDKTEIQNFLGMLSFLTWFIPHLSENYSNIEWECLAVIFGLEHFRQFCYWWPVVIHSDHKPFESIFTKPVSLTQPHLQRMLLQISIFDIKLMYIKGKEIQAADCLFHLIKANKDDQISGLDIVVHDVEFTLSHEKLNNVAETTLRDQVL